MMKKQFTLAESEIKPFQLLIAQLSKARESVASNLKLTTST
jgi:hypothetical protein